MDLSFLEKESGASKVMQERMSSLYCVVRKRPIAPD